MTIPLFNHRILLILSSIVLVFVLFVVAEFLYIVHNGTPVAVPTIPRTTQTQGSGPELTFVVMGDSTSIAQGAQYDQGIASASANYLAKNYTVHMTNVGISGARTQTVLSKQLSKAAALKPDVVLLAVGANDVTHFTWQTTITRSMQQIIDGLVASNCRVKIVLTGSPAMGSVPRFPWPVKQAMGIQTNRINQTLQTSVAKNNLTWAAVATRTGQSFIDHPEWFAPDNLHPTAAGYASWEPVIIAAISEALARQPSHCA